MAALAPARLLRERADNPALAGELGAGDEFARLDARENELHAAERVSDVSCRCTVLLRLARASRVRRLLARPVDRGASRGDKCSRAEYRRMVRHLSARHDSQLQRDARARWKRGGARGTASDHRTMESRGAVSEPGRRGRFWIPLEPRFGRYRRHHAALLRPLAQRQSGRRRGSAGTNLRDGHQPVARRKGVAASRHRFSPLLPAQPRPRQQHVRRRRALDRCARRRAARFVPLQPARSGADGRRWIVLLPRRAAGRCVRSASGRASRRRAGVHDRTDAPKTSK